MTEAILNDEKGKFEYWAREEGLNVKWSAVGGYQAKMTEMAYRAWLEAKRAYSQTLAVRIVYRDDLRPTKPEDFPGTDAEWAEHCAYRDGLCVAERNS